MMKAIRDAKFKQDLESEMDRMLVCRAQLFDELDRFPRNAKAEAKKRRMDRHIQRMKKTLRELD